MSRQDLPFWVDRSAQGLRDPNDDSTDQCAPQRAKTTYDHGLKGVDQPCGANVGVKVRPQAKVDCRDSDNDQCDTCLLYTSDADDE